MAAAIPGSAVYSGHITHAADNTTTSTAVGINKTLTRGQTLLGWGTWGSTGAIALYGSPDSGTTWVEIAALTANGKITISDAFDLVLVKRKTDDTLLDVQFMVMG